MQLENSEARRHPNAAECNSSCMQMQIIHNLDSSELVLGTPAEQERQFAE
jgi:hypothetical protein